MKQQLEAIHDSAVKGLAQAKGQQALEMLWIKYLGRKGELTSILKQTGGLSAGERPMIGQLVNQVHSLIEKGLTKCASEPKDQVIQVRLGQEKLDVTPPGKHHESDAKHSLSIVLDEIREIFVGMGSRIVDGPEVEYDYYNLEVLNIPRNRPVRDTQDTFYTNDGIVLRTQTSPVQVRVMEKTQPPIHTISPNRVYCSDAADVAHSPPFHRIEGPVVDKSITFASLRDTLKTLVKRLHDEDSVVRFRPHHSPFIEPSAEVNAQCFNCHDGGCRLCKGEGWIEVLGYSMVHPKVLSNYGTDPEVYSGSALDIGLERVVMHHYDTGDLYLSYENDIRLLKQFQEVSPE